MSHRVAEIFKPFILLPFPIPSLADPVIRHHLNLPPLPEAFQKLKQSGKITSNW